jgi:hypothetical protein
MTLRCGDPVPVMEVPYCTVLSAGLPMLLSAPVPSTVSVPYPQRYPNVAHRSQTGFVLEHLTLASRQA